MPQEVLRFILRTGCINAGPPVTPGPLVWPNRFEHFRLFGSRRTARVGLHGGAVVNYIEAEGLPEDIDIQQFTQKIGEICLSILLLLARGIFEI